MTEDNHLPKEVIQWGYEYLISHGYTLKSNLSEQVQNTPWSHVVRFATTDGYIYLKHTPKLIALEATITKILHDQFHASVPIVIGHHAELNSFLMKDAGKPLREILKIQFDTALLCRAMDQFTSLQLAVSDHVDIFFSMGVPDWRINKLPELFDQFLTQKDLLIADGLSEIEMNELETTRPVISHLCKKLFSYSIKESIVQPDFHDNNLLIDDMKNITIIDLGEIVISHPFFSLVNCLRQVKKHHALKDEDETYQALLDACFKNYMQFESKKNLLSAFSLAEVLWYVYVGLANDRLREACGNNKLMRFQPGKLSGLLKEFMIACRSGLK